MLALLCMSGSTRTRAVSRRAASSVRETEEPVSTVARSFFAPFGLLRLLLSTLSYPLRCQKLRRRCVRRSEVVAVERVGVAFLLPLDDCSTLFFLALLHRYTLSLL